jgi:hypothetical protein
MKNNAADHLIVSARHYNTMKMLSLEVIKA